MPYRFLSEDFENDYRSVWVDVPQSLYDGRKVHGLYNEYLDELALPGGHMLHLESPDAVADAAAKFLSS